MAKLRNLKILFVTSEVMPFVKTGGLADVSSSLPQILSELGHEVRIVVPKYGAVDERRFKIHEIVRLKDIPIHLGEDIELFSIRSSFLAGIKTKVQIYFFDNFKYFGSRKGLYQDPVTKKEYPDNYERFILFNRGIIEVIKKLGWTPDIIHCNDWQSGLIPAYLKTEYSDIDLLKNTKSVFTIHNLAFQGTFPKEIFKLTGLPTSILNENGIELNGKISFLKSGIVFSDVLNTVSKKYAEEIRTSDDISGSLRPILNKRKNDLHGIINGIDYNIWNPETDKIIANNYNLRNLGKKLLNKQLLCQEFGLKFDEDVPLMGTVSRMSNEKGFDLIEKSISKILDLNISYIILGEGEKKYQDLFAKIKKKYPQKFGLKIGFDDNLAHKIIAGSDLFLMPSKIEPCGLTQLYSLRYGTIPIVHHVGGLVDTIIKINDKGTSGTGFAFKKYDAKEMLNEIKRALKLYADKENWVKLMKNGMNQDFSWYSSARQYVDLYKKVVKEI